MWMTRTELSTAGSSQKLSLWVDLSWSSTVCGARQVILLGEVTMLLTVAVKMMLSTEESTEVWMGLMQVLASKERLMFADDEPMDPELVR